MGIKLNVSMNQDYSQLFQSLSSGGGMGNLNFLSDYASIKNGSYAKLMKTYYGGAQNSSTAYFQQRRAVQAMFWTKFWTRRRIQRFPRKLRRQTLI